MIKRLEQVAAVVVAAGLAIVSYWLFFSWAQGGGADRRRPRLRGQVQIPAGQLSRAGRPAALPGGSVRDRRAP
jgi:hypothetical protein